MINDSSRFRKNRKKLVKEQLDYWQTNKESGILRLTERILLGFNVSDILAGDLGQIEHLDDVSIQIRERRQLDGPILQKTQKGSTLTSSEATSSQYLFEFSNVKVDVLTGLVVLDAGFVVDSTLAKWQKIIFRGGIGSSVKRTRRSSKKVLGKYMVLPHSPFYYHTLIDEMPNLIRIRDEYRQCNNVIVHQLTPVWALDLLSYFGFNVKILDQKAIIVESLFALSAPRAIVQKNLEYLRHQLQFSPSDIVVVSRKGAPRSDNAIEQALASQIRGSVLIDPGDFAVEEQIKIFSHARIVIGLHGGALTNCIWMDKSGTLIEIFNHAYRTKDYERLCTELDIGYLSIEVESSTPEEVCSAVRRLLIDFPE